MQKHAFIACCWGKYEKLFTQEYHIPWGQCPRGTWYSWVNKFSYFLNPHAIDVLLYRMKPRKHIDVKYCWQTYFKSIGMLSQPSKNHIHNNKDSRSISKRKQLMCINVVFVSYWLVYFFLWWDMEALFHGDHCNGRLHVMHSECLWRFPVKER